MNWRLSHLSTRLALAFAVLIVTLSAVGLVVWRELESLSAEAADLSQRRVHQVVRLGAIRREVAVAQSQLRQLLLSRSEDQAQSAVAGSGKAVEAMSRELDAFEKDIFSQEARDHVSRLRQQIAAYSAARSEVISVFRSAGRDRAFDQVLNGTDPARKPLLATLTEALEWQQKVMQARVAQVAGETRSIQGLMLGALVLMAGMAVGSAVWLMRHLHRRTEEALQVARRIAANDLEARVEVTGADEFTPLLKEMGVMRDALHQLVAAARGASEQIQTASTEVAAANQDLSGRTEQTAGSLQETASSLDSLTATVQQTAKAAEQAHSLASAAAQAANQGGELVGQVVQTMGDISQSSQRIADIITVIDGIAFQTNILALNAAVEAARAGEQGRGFAVVAGEVRTLAQRSATAAREIKDLIGASVARVQSGDELVRRAGQSMEDIVTQVRRVNDIMADITCATGEQSAGLAQVNTAVGQLEQMTQQNAALVEQNAAAAESLQGQAERLTGVVSAFRV